MPTTLKAVTVMDQGAKHPEQAPRSLAQRLSLSHMGSGQFFAEGCGQGFTGIWRSCSLAFYYGLAGDLTMVMASMEQLGELALNSSEGITVTVAVLWGGSQKYNEDHQVSQE